MVEISDKHVEWAVVNRLKAMLDAPPKTEFNVTQSFAMFSAIVLWTKQRAWVSGKQCNRLATFGRRTMQRTTCVKSCSLRAFLTRRGCFRRFARS